MKRRRVLAFFLAVSMLASNMASVSAAEIESVENSQETTSLLESISEALADNPSSLEDDDASGTEDLTPEDSADEEEAPAEEETEDETTDPSEEEQVSEDSSEEVSETEEESQDEGIMAVDLEEDDDDASLPTPLLSFDFEELSAGKDIIYNNAKAAGSYTLADSYQGGGTALHLNGTSQYLNVTNTDGGSLLTGVTELTVSYEAKYDRTDTNWVMYASNSTAAPSYGKERYIGILQKNGTLTVERYNNTGSRVSAADASVATNEWIHVDVVYGTSDTKVYVEGQLKTTVTSSYALDTLLGSSSILQIGKANWGSGEYFQGSIDNLKIYDKALSASQVQTEYKAYVDTQYSEAAASTELTLNAGYVSEDLTLPTTFGNASVTWSSSDENVISNDGKVTRGSENQNVTLTATLKEDGKEDSTKEFPLVVLAEGPDVVTYTSSSPATGQSGGMKIAIQGTDGYTVLHKDQPILYTTYDKKSFVSPQAFRKADGTFGLVAADGGSNGTILLYDSEDLITYTNERTIELSGINSIEKLACVYDMEAKVYKLFVENTVGKCYVLTSEDLTTFGTATLVDYSFADVAGPSDAVWDSKIALTNAEGKALEAKFSNPYNTELDTSDVKTSATVEQGASIDAVKEQLSSEVTATYSDGTSRKLSVQWSDSDLETIDTDRPGTYTITGTIGGTSNYTDVDDPLIEERADPYIVYDDVNDCYYFTASYPMQSSSDADGYDRLVLRTASTISGLADAEEVTIWDESEDSARGRFIWAPELHKIGDYWYFISTAAINSGTGTSFNIRPFMIKSKKEASKMSQADMMNPEMWGDPVDVKAADGDTKNCLAGMSLDMTYFEAGGKSYVVWADETKSTLNPNGTSYLYIATVDPSDPTQLTSNCTVITTPEYSWECVNISVNEGPAVFVKDGTVYLAYSASATGSEYCVGLLTADATADLTQKDSWTKNPYPILTSADFGDEVSGPGHNSFTVDENGNPVIVYHARPTTEHASHTGDSLYDACRHCYVKQVFFDEDGMPILNLSDTEFVSDATVTATVTVTGEAVSTDPILVYDFDETYTKGTAKDSTGNGNDATLSKKAVYVQDEEYGQVLYLDGSTSVGGHNSYLEFPEGFFDGKDSVTISMDVNEVTRRGYFFTFTIGQDSDKYLYLKTLPTSMKISMTTGSYSKEVTASKSFTYPNNARTWVNVKIVLTPTSMSLYQDGKLLKTVKNTGIKLSDLGTDLKAYLGKSFYSSDSYFRGYFDNIKVYDYAMTAQEVKSATEAEAAARKAAREDIEEVAELFEIPDADNIKGNITLPSEKNGVTINWTSSDENIVSTVANGSTPAGVVTRPDADTKVTLKAVFSKGEASITKTYELTVKAKPQELKESDFTGYLFVHFTGSEEDGTKEQTYFSVSTDGLNWTDLNDNQPYLTSTLGESGVRDHYIGRSAEGDKFYMIATDLSIANNSSWSEAGSNGSHSIVIWESDDLVNWSDPWLADIAPEGAGCTWAPEFIYDDTTGEYIIYWSATTLEVDENENITQEYENHAIYYCKTRDFRTFTDAQLYHKGDGIKVIDSTMIEYNGTYYRYTKNESKGIIEIDKSDAILGEYTSISSTTLSSTVPNSVGAVEGPIIFKMNKANASDADQWCLMVDRYGTGSGYYPLITNDLESGEFTALSSSEYSMPSKYRHGYVMSITQEEYNALTGNTDSSDEKTVTETTLTKSNGNPMLGFDANGDTIYGGDPSILVDGDTVYCYVGHDTSSSESYYMPDWYCYSSTDMENWTYEGTILEENRTNIKWANDDYEAWAGQVMKGSDGLYYFFYCTQASSAYGGGKSIGLAVSSSPKGKFVDIGQPLVRDVDTDNGVHTWEDIDPTAWIETDENGVEHCYLGWGNTRFFVCELNLDGMNTTIKDRDGDPDTLSVGYSDDGTYDIVIGTINGNRNIASGSDRKLYFTGSDGVEHYYTEAPYFYRQQNADGTYTGYYYLFFASDWREQMAYAYTTDIMSNNWTFGGIVMEPSATGNTNHMAVFDFKGNTYFVYHDGSLEHGSGFRRVACVEQFEINEDGSIDMIKKTAIGLTGTASTITDIDGNYLAIEDFENTLDDNDYPMTDKEVLIDSTTAGETAEWEINAGKADKTKDAYVSIESNQKPGLYLTVSSTKNSDGTYPVVHAQEGGGTTDEANRMTFRTLEGFAGSGVTFESVAYPGYYLVSRDGEVLLASDPTDEEATFNVTAIVKETEKDDDNSEDDTDVTVAHDIRKTVTLYTTKDTMAVDDIRIWMCPENASEERITEYTTNVSELDLSSTGEKTLKVTWEYKGKSYTDDIRIQVVDASYRSN